MNLSTDDSEKDEPYVDSAYFQIRTGYGSIHMNSDDIWRKLETNVYKNTHSAARPGLDLEDDGEIDVENYVSFHVKTTDMGTEEASVQMDIPPEKAIELGRDFICKGLMTRQYNERDGE